jgi:hypothetical protein
MPRSKPAPPSKPSTSRPEQSAPHPEPAVDALPTRESLEGFAERAKSSFEALTTGRDEQRAAREAEREEVARALKVALKAAPELKLELERVTDALKEARQKEDEVEARLSNLVKAGLAELAELSERHLR